MSSRLALSAIVLAGSTLAATTSAGPALAKSSAGLTPVNILQCPGGDRCIAPDTAVDSAGNIHLVYGTSDKMAIYVRSSDNGATWTSPVILNGALNVTTTMGERGPRIAASYAAASGKLVLHVVWADLWFPGAKTYARYSQSTDGGVTWSAPTQASDVSGIDGLTVTAGSAGGVDVAVVFYHVLEGPPPANASSATWLYATYSTDGGATFAFPATQVTASLAPGQPAGPIPSCSMCATRARVVGGRILFAMRTAADDIRDHFLLNGTLLPPAAAPMEATRVPTIPPWYITSCPMNGPELSVDVASGRVAVAYMTSASNDVHWALHDPTAAPGPSFFSATAASPTQEGNERYASAVTSSQGDVLMVWNVGPMAVSGTALVKYALYGLDGRLIPGSNATIGTSFAGTRAQAFVGGNDEFYIVTTAR